MAPLINRAQKFHTNDVSLPRFGWCFRLVVLLEKFASTNQKHTPGVNLIKFLQVQLLFSNSKTNAHTCKLHM